MKRFKAGKNHRGNLFIRTLTMIIIYSIIISVTVIGFFYVIAKEATRKSYDRQYASILSSSCNSVDSTLEHISNSIALMAEDYDFLNASISSSAANYTDVRFMLLSLANTSEIVKEYAYYKVNSDCIISSNRLDMLLDDYELADLVRGYLASQLTGSYMAYSNYYTDVFEHNGEFIFIRDFPIRGEKRLGLILCRMDIASLYRWFKRSQGAYANQIYVFNREGGPLWGSLAEYDADILEAYQTCSTQGETSITRNGTRMYYPASKASGWSYILSVPEPTLLGNWTEDTLRLPAIFLIIFLMGLIMSISLRNTIIAPLQRMVDTFCDPHTRHPAAGVNELDQLRVAISEIISNRDRLTATINELLPAISDQFFTEMIISKRGLDRHYVQRMLDSISSAFKLEGAYAIVVMSQADTSGYPSEELYSMMESTLAHHAQSIAERRIQWLDAPRHLALILECSPEIDKAGQLVVLENICLELYRAITRAFPDIRWKQNVFCGKLTELCFAYSEALSASDSAKTLRAADAAKTQLDYNHFYVRVDAALAALNEGDTQDAERLLLSCIDSITALFSCPKTQYDFMRTFESVLADYLQNSSARIMPELMSPVLHVYDGQKNAADNAAAYREALMAYCSSLCVQIQEYNIKRKHKSLVAAQKYMEQHYCDSDLSLENVADAVGINPTYLSKLFIHNMGIGFVTYTNTLRVEKACHILETNDMAVKDIAQAVGFNSQQNFFRVFKKIKGVTPGQYKATAYPPQDGSNGSEDRPL